MIKKVCMIVPLWKTCGYIVQLGDIGIFKGIAECHKFSSLMTKILKDKSAHVIILARTISGE